GRNRVVVLSHALWSERYGGDPSVVGREIDIGGAPYAVVGVMPEGLSFPTASTRLWVPLAYAAANSGFHWGSYHLRTVGRLSAGVTPAVAREDVRGLARLLRTENPIWTPGEIYYETVDVVPLHEHVVGSSAPMLLVLTGAVALVLLIACVNVANVLLARASSREREVAIRMALGAGRSRLMRQLLTESVLLACAGGVAGLMFAFGAVRMLRSILPADVPRADEIAIDANVLLFTAVVALATGVVFGLVPSLRGSLREIQSTLREGGRTGSTARQRRWTGALVSAEVALSVVLVIGAGLLIRSFWRLAAVDPGFRVEQVVSARVSPPELRYDEASASTFYRTLIDRLATSPAFRSAGATSQLPFDQARESMAMWIDEYTTNPNVLTMLDSRRITPGFLEALGIALIRGRAFTAADAAGAPGVALIDEESARRYWPGRDPIGGRIRYPWPSEWLTVVGVVANAKNNDLAQQGEGAFYVPYPQRPEPAMTVVVRTLADAASVAGMLREAVKGLDPEAPVSDVRTMQELVSASVAEPRFTAILLLGFAAVALALGAVGIYGVIAYAVSQRIREIGVRMALGARQGDVLRMVVRQGAVLAAIGIAIGLVAAFGLTRVLSGFLFGVSPRDAGTFVAVPALLAAVALLASYLPSRRATRVDPMAVLRNE
ncbi:MAG: ABC transporter permease, partial [Longimicrobiales bacterium]